jgi:hypothetical protein
MFEKTRSILTSPVIFLCVVATTTVMAAPPTSPPPITVDGNVLNDADHPVPVILPAPVQGSITGVSTKLGTVYTVPEGKRLAIGFVSISGTKEPNQDRLTFQVKTTLASTEVTHSIIRLSSSDFNSNDGFAVSKTVQLFADPNTEVVFRVVGNLGFAIAAWGGTLTGRLEPVPDELISAAQETITIEANE